jgi:hypothetical protein
MRLPSAMTHELAAAARAAVAQAFADLVGHEYSNLALGLADATSDNESATADEHFRKGLQVAADAYARALAAIADVAEPYKKPPPTSLPSVSDRRG